MTKSVMIVEDCRDLSHLVSLHLRDMNYEVEQVYEGETCLERLRGRTYDLIILDLMLPGIGGLEVCRQLRSGDTYTPILMLTAKSTEADRVVGLELGADDYQVKPFSIPELMARVRALFRRVDAMRMPGQDQDPALPTISVGEILIDPVKRRVSRQGKSITLTAMEFKLLVQFARNPGRVYSRSQLLDLVWGYGHDGYEHTVNSHINRLRSKLEQDPSKPEYLLTVWGVGYKFFDPDECEADTHHA